MPPRYLLVFLLLLAARLCLGGNHTQLIKVLYDLEKYPLAVCNDGTAGALGACGAQREVFAASSPLRSPIRRSGGFYFIPATNPEKVNTWVVILEGGQWCALGWERLRVRRRRLRRQRRRRVCGKRAAAARARAGSSPTISQVLGRHVLRHTL